MIEPKRIIRCSNFEENSSTKKTLRRRKKWQLQQMYRFVNVLGGSP